MRRSRRWRWVGVALLLLVGLYFVFDVVMLQYVESRGAAEIASTMAAEDATVDLGGIPFLTEFLRGRLSGAEVDVRGATGSGGLRVQSIKARLSDLRFDASDVFALTGSSFATRTKVKGEDPFGVLELGEADLEDYLRRTIPSVGDVEVTSSGILVRFLKDRDDPAPERPHDKDLTKPARYLPNVVGGKVVLSLLGVASIPVNLRGEAARVEEIIDLPKLPAGLSNDARLGDGVVIIEASGPEVELTVGEGGV